MGSPPLKGFGQGDPALSAWAEATYRPEDEVLREIRERSEREGLPPIAVGRFDGLHLEVLARLSTAQTAVEIDAEVRRIVMDEYDRAKKIISENMDKLKAMAEALLEYETIDSPDIDKLMGGGKLDRPLPVKRPPVAKAEKKDDKKEKRPGLFAPRPLPNLKDDPGAA